MNVTQQDSLSSGNPNMNVTRQDSPSLLLQSQMKPVQNCILYFFCNYCLPLKGDNS